jgi:hypothetical protein
MLFNIELFDFGLYLKRLVTVFIDDSEKTVNLVLLKDRGLIQDIDAAEVEVSLVFGWTVFLLENVDDMTALFECFKVILH